MHKLKIVYLPFASLIPSVYNSNTHPKEQIKQIAGSIKKFGFNQPIAIDSKNNILAGEGRYYAAKLLSCRDVPTICLSHLNESEQRAYIIADNQIARNSIWDPIKLSSEISALMSMDFDIGVLAFDNDQILEILKDAEQLTKDIYVKGHSRTGKTEKEPKVKTKPKQLAVLVYCEDLEEQLEIFERFTSEGLKCENTLI